MVTAAVLIPIVIFRWAVDVFDLDVLKTWYDATGVALRVINSSQTLVMAQGFAMALWGIAFGTASAAGWMLAPFLASFIVVLQHRSVWAVAAAALALSFALGRRGIVPALAVSAAIGLSVVLVVKGASSGTGVEAAAQIGRSAAMASVSKGTFGARITGWRMSLKQFSAANPLKQLVGQPYGGGYGIEFMTEKGKVGFFPHNYYIQVLIRGGVAGLVIFLTLYAATAYWLVQAAVRDGDRWAALFAVLLGTQLVYFIPYGSPFTQGVILGLALVVAREARRRARPAVRVPSVRTSAMPA
jgi:hypothetical protein